jgi:hypothetical protein
MNARESSNHLAALLRNERSAMSDFLLALADFDRQKLWRELGHASLFSFLRRELGLSAGAAQYRKTAAELIQRFSEVEAALREGRLCLSTVIEVAKVLTAENQHEVLPRFFGLSRREAEMVAASIRPAEVIPRREVVTTIRPAAPVVADPPRARAAAPETPPSLELRPPEAFALAPVRPAEPPEAAHPESLLPVGPPRDTAGPLDGSVSRLHVTVSRRLLAKLEAAKDALSHSMPGATAGEILEVGLDLLLAKAAKRKGVVEKPRKEPPPSQSDAVPAHVKRAVWRRAGGRCEWRLGSGEVCGSTHLLEFDHHPIPRAHGGPATIDNIRLHCKLHNLLGARRVFGDACMDRYTRQRREAVTSTNRAAPRDAPAPSACRPADVRG